jgi:hypothetical protein
VQIFVFIDCHQVGRVIDNPTDFYASRLTNKERKATFAEELLADTNAISYTKRKSDEIYEKHNSKQRRKKPRTKKK